MVSDVPFTTSQTLFEAHLRWLADHHFTSLTLDQFERRIDGEAPEGTCREVLITFDDGHRSQQDLATPLLRRYGFRAASFIVTDWIGEDETLSWGDIVDLTKSGHLEFASHTHSHQRWTLGLESTEQVADEIQRSNTLLADHLGLAPTRLTRLAWPYGRTCPQWENAAADQGVTTQFVVQRGAVTHQGQHHRLPRLLADGMGAKQFAFWMRVLSHPTTAKATNTVFGLVRQQRQGAGYR